MRIITFILLCIVSARLMAAAVGTPPAPLTVEEAVGLALRNNPLARAAAHQVGAAQAGVGAARSLANPSLTVTPGILGSAGSDEELSITQPLEISGTRSARTRVARAELQVARSEAAVTVRDVVRDVKLAYYELARAQELLSLQRESVGIAEEFERVARRQVELGARTGIDLTQLQIESTRARQLQLRAEAGVRLAAADLNTLMGRAPGIPVVLPIRGRGSEGAKDVSPGAAAGVPEVDLGTAGQLPAPDPSLPPSLEEAALDRRGEIAAEQARLESLRQQVRLIRAEGRPDLVVGGRLDSFTRSPRTGGVGLGITLPILDYGSRRNRLRQTERLSEAQAARVEATRNQVRRDVEAAAARLSTAEQLVRQYEEGLVAQARRLAEAERTRFQTGTGSPLTVLEAQRTYRSVLSDYYAALAAHDEAKAELEWATGSVEVPRDVDVLPAAGSTRKDVP